MLVVRKPASGTELCCPRSPAGPGSGCAWRGSLRLGEVVRVDGVLDQWD